MREVLLLTIAILAADKANDATPSATIATKYGSISAEYDRAMGIARSRNAPMDELRRIGETRQQAFRELISDGLRQPDKMSGADWAAIAMANEYLFQSGECIRYASRAIELDPRTKEAYAPLIRSLLNGNRIEEAETALASAEKYINDGTKWHGMHYFLFIKHREQKHWGKAATHLENVLETMLLEGGDNVDETRQAAKYLGDYLVTTKQAGLENHGRQQLRMWLHSCAKASEQKLRKEGADVRELQHCAALCEAQCEIAKRMPELMYEEYLLLWARLLYDPRWAAYERDCRSQQMYYGKYVVTNAVTVKKWQTVAAGFAQLLKERFDVESAKQSEESKTILIKLHSFAESRVAGESAAEMK